VSLFEGLAAHTCGLVAGDTVLLADAARLLGRTHRPLLAAAADEDTGRSLADPHRPSAAIGPLNAAFDVYAAHGAAADARRVSRLLRGHGVSRRAPRAVRQELGFASLTDSELQVVRIIAGGATNRSAAEQLYLSPHTVSSHLRSAFTKLGINSRVQLALVLRERET
jgi:DNA-binding CsgD family transcriptional regulator